MNAAVHSGLFVGITNQLAAVVFSCTVVAMLLLLLDVLMLLLALMVELVSG